MTVVFVGNVPSMWLTSVGSNADSNVVVVVVVVTLSLNTIPGYMPDGHSGESSWQDVVVIVLQVLVYSFCGGFCK